MDKRSFMNLLIIFIAKYLIAVPVLVLLAYLVFSRGKVLTQLMWLTAVSLPLAYLLARLSSVLYYDPRPFIEGHFTPLIAHAADNGFPSDHTLLAATLATIILYVDNRAGTLLWLIAVAIGVSRIFAGVHHTVDILASMIIAVAAVVLAQYSVSKVRRA